MAHNTTGGGEVIITDMNRFLAVVATWLMVLVTLAQGGPGGPGGGGSGSPTLSPAFELNDWTGNAAATDRSFFPANLPATEGFYRPVVYTKGGSAQVKVFFYNNNPQEDFDGELVVTAATYKHFSSQSPGLPGGGSGSSITDTILVVPNAALEIESEETGFATLSISGLPEFVTHGYIRLDMRAEGNFGAAPPGSVPVAWSGSPLTQTVYITYAEPTGVMDPVWIELAEISCRMAQGVTMASDVNLDLTEGLFKSNIFKYDLPEAAASYTDITNHLNSVAPKVVSFELKLLLGELAEGSTHLLANCADINSFLGLLHHAQGIPATGRVVYGAFPVGTTEFFLTNEIVPIGYSASLDSNYIRIIFKYHFQLLVGDGVSDASLSYRQNLSGSTWKKVAYAWNYGGSWQTWLDPSMLGLAYRQHSSSDTTTSHGTYPFLVHVPGLLTPFVEDKVFKSYTFTEVK